MISDITIKSLLLDELTTFEHSERSKACSLNCEISDVLCPLEFQVEKENAKTILGLKNAIKLNLISLYPDVHEITPSSCQLPKPG